MGDRREIGRSDVLKNIVRNFVQASEKQAALALMERPAGLLHEAVQAVQKMDQVAEARGGGLEQASMLRERMLSRRIVQAFEKWLPALAAQLRRHGKTLGQVAVIGPYDLMIAGHARSRGLIVVTGNLGEFQRVLGLRCEDWLA